MSRHHGRSNLRPAVIQPADGSTPNLVRLASFTFSMRAIDGVSAHQAAMQERLGKQVTLAQAVDDLLLTHPNLPRTKPRSSFYGRPDRD